MHTTTIPCCLVLSALLGVSCAANADLDFETWVTKHNKLYTQKEKAQRARIFAENAITVARHNAAYARKETAFAMSLAGPFSDLTDAEFSHLHLMEPQNCSATHNSSGPVPKGSGSLPKAKEWRTHAVITPIKSQGHCGRWAELCSVFRAVVFG